MWMRRRKRRGWRCTERDGEASAVRDATRRAEDFSLLFLDILPRVVQAVVVLSCLLFSLFPASSCQMDVRVSRIYTYIVPLPCWCASYSCAGCRLPLFIRPLAKALVTLTGFILATVSLLSSLFFPSPGAQCAWPRVDGEIASTFLLLLLLSLAHVAGFRLVISLSFAFFITLLGLLVLAAAAV